MEEEKLREAFQRIKQDIDFIKYELEDLKNNLFDLALIIKESSTHSSNRQTDRQQFDTYSTHIPTQNRLFKPLKDQNLPISIGNEGVPTDRQTNQQTDRQTTLKTINEVSSILDTLDGAKREIRLKFKQLTDQELLIFSIIYQLTEEKGYSEYKSIAEKLSLTESSIRDYVGRLIKKGIPIEKEKVNNKQIHLSISQNLRRIANLSTILQLRDL